MNPDQEADLGAVRLDEWKQAGQFLGAKSMEFLGYKDGHLCNLDMIEISKRLTDYITEILKSAPEDATVEFMTLDLNGYTGHIDHIVAARAACYVFYTLKQSDARFSRIRFACLPDTLFPTLNVGWILMEPGRSPEEIDETVDARHLRDDILKVMQLHRSQRRDYEATLHQQGDKLGLNYFIVKS